MNDDQIKHMVNRFLSWKLPETFTPDGGVTFERFGNAGTPDEFRREPSGTNLLDATQAEAMVRHMLEGLPSGSAPPVTLPPEPSNGAVDVVDMLHAQGASWSDCLSAAYAIDSRPAAPDGWRLVPVEPTRDMVDAWRQDQAQLRSLESSYRAMIGAAPTPKGEKP